MVARIECDFVVANIGPAVDGGESWDLTDVNCHACRPNAFVGESGLNSDPSFEGSYPTTSGRKVLGNFVKLDSFAGVLVFVVEELCKAVEDVVLGQDRDCIGHHGVFIHVRRRGLHMSDGKLLSGVLGGVLSLAITTDSSADFR